MTPAAQWNSSYIWFQKCLLALKRLFFGSHIKAIRPSSKEAICWKRRCFLICWVALNLYHRPKIERSKPKIPQDVSFVKNRRKENTRSRLRQVVDDQLENKKPIFFLNALNFSWKKNRNRDLSCHSWPHLIAFKPLWQVHWSFRGVLWLRSVLTGAEVMWDWRLALQSPRSANKSNKH